MDAGVILSEFVNGTLIAGLVLIIALPLSAVLNAFSSQAILNRLHAFNGRVETYLLDWRRSFF